VRTAVVYYSETGNTAKVADAIAAALTGEAPGEGKGRGHDEAGAHGADVLGADVVLSSLQDAPALDGHCQGALAEPARQHMLSSGVPMLAEFAKHAGVADGQPDEAALARAAAFAREIAGGVRSDLAAGVAAV
jgi:hypothetical protein